MTMCAKFHITWTIEVTWWAFLCLNIQHGSYGLILEYFYSVFVLLHKIFLLCSMTKQKNKKPACRILFVCVWTSWTEMIDYDLQLLSCFKDLYPCSLLEVEPCCKGRVLAGANWLFFDVALCSNMSCALRQQNMMDNVVVVLTFSIQGQRNHLGTLYF